MVYRFRVLTGQVGQELYIEVCKLERIIRTCVPNVPNTHTRVRESCPPCPKDVLKSSNQAIYTWYKWTSRQNKSSDQEVQLNVVKKGLYNY